MAVSSPGLTGAGRFTRSKSPSRCASAYSCRPFRAHLPDGTYGGSAGGFMVESAEGKFYYSGDTALTLDMKIISEKNKPKFAVLCIRAKFTLAIDDPIPSPDPLQ